MGTSAHSQDPFWGYLIQDDKSPSPLFEQLLLGIANYIVSWTGCLCSATHSPNQNDMTSTARLTSSLI